MIDSPASSPRAAEWHVAIAAAMVGVGGTLLGLQIDADGRLSGTGLTSLAIGILLALVATLVHAKASIAKLFLSEAANRCADRCLQIFGGRGYMRTNVAERFFRELRVDRIWEGTSEIQRPIVARAWSAEASNE